jgi:inner membrane protein
MDNLTHSLVGALLGQMGLKRKTGLAMPTLIIAANIPDIDAVAVLLGGHQHLAIRRGITHGPIAMFLLPLLLWGIMLWFDRWQTRRGTRPANRLPVDAKWLLALAFIGCLSHPMFDWFNSYGVRLLEPFSSQWYYGDTLFIIDVWIWIVLIAGVWASLRCERRGLVNWQRPAGTAFLGICAYIFANGLITSRAEYDGYAQLTQKMDIRPADNSRLVVVANPVPLAFWKREMLWRDAPFFGKGVYSLGRGASWVSESRDAHPDPGSDWSVLQYQNADLSAFLFWSRMPVVEIRVEDDERKLVVSDQRFGNELVRDRFAWSIPLKKTK